ncbi:hypothetical protein AJ78_01699 [Emergomyces pasteurianus Ep9510]|uniref:Heterokaryon incompatibility domain-containing protein n=1 Tax=Emergomyces pasteurianus Ep9510 TaxID=1447872 RepID=A0A1J9QQW0_9EURO|nr:hypothetical protein AJ78_01699 [Emergomyces pasteurianus Ep9510]
MQLDQHSTFGEIFPNPLDLKKQVIEIANNVHDRTLDFGNRPKFLAVSRSPAVRNYTLDDARTAGITLSLVQPQEEQRDDYLAVSYCWPQNEGTPHPSASNVISESRSYCDMPLMIQQLDGTIRKSRAPCRILRRAMAHAADDKLKYIWIDQECIEQHDDTEKARAVEVMDRMYASAYTVLSLLDIRLSDRHAEVAMKALERPQPSLDLTNMIMQWVYRSDPEDFLNAADSLCHILELVASDRWFTRAWIMQERLCSSTQSGSDDLWVMCPESLPTRVPGEMSISATNFNLVMPAVLQEREWQDNNLKARLQAAYKNFCDAYDFPFEVARDRSRRNRFNVMQGVQLLADKGCSVPADKLALVANCCDWFKRVGADLVNRPDISYSACLWTLAMMNGDASMFCQDPACASTERNQRMLWMPSKNTSLIKLACPKATRDVKMRITEHGLETPGWLWRVVKFVDLGSLTLPASSVIYDEESQLQHKKFYWTLLRKLSSINLHSAANVLWKGLKYRASSGIYGRHLVEVPDISYDQIISPMTGQYTVSYELLGFKDSTDYRSTTDSITQPNAFYHRFCPYDESLEDYHHTDCDLTQEQNFHLLLGDARQLAAFSWILDSIKMTGGISIGRLIDKTKDNNVYQKEPPLVITDTNHTYTPKHTHIFTQFRHVVKHRHGDPTEKRLLTWSPFDVWLVDRETHLDTPFSWSAYKRESHGVAIAAGGDEVSSPVTAMNPCNVLFDIANVPYQDHTLDWPDEFYQSSWSVSSLPKNAKPPISTTSDVLVNQEPNQEPA